MNDSDLINHLSQLRIQVDEMIGKVKSGQELGKMLFSLDSLTLSNYKLLEYMYAQLDTGLLTFSIKTCENYTRAMLDCGSTRDFIDKSWAIKCGMQQTKLRRPLFVKLINDEVITVTHRIVRCPLKFRRNFSDCRDLYVIDMNSDFDVILGQPFLRD